MIKIDIDLKVLEVSVGKALGRQVILKPLKVKCTYPVFVGVNGRDGVPPPSAGVEKKVFVKVGLMSEWEQTRKVNSAIGDCDLIPKLLVTEPIEYRGYAVFVTEWREGKIVYPEDFNEAQLKSFVDGCVRLSEVLNSEKFKAAFPLDELPPMTSDYGVINQFRKRFPVMAKTFGRLLKISSERRIARGANRAIIHGDFHAKNFSFIGDKLTTVYDFDKLGIGYKCGDVINALGERFSLLSMSKKKQARLIAVTRRILAMLPWSGSEMYWTSISLRLRFAASRIRKHPNLPLIALDVRRRDKGLFILTCLIQEVFKNEISQPTNEIMRAHKLQTTND